MLLLRFFLFYLILIVPAEWIKAGQDQIIIKGNVRYDFTFAEMAADYLETGDTSLLYVMADMDALAHIENHISKYNRDLMDSKINIVKKLLSPREEKMKILPEFRRNIGFAKKEIAETDLPQTECLKYLPSGFTFNSTLFFTFGYDIGVVYGNNASINLANKIFIADPNELKYYAIHELHHAAFVSLKSNEMPSLEISTYGQMAELIAYFTQLEGMGTYAPLNLRIKENAMNSDSDYIRLQDSLVLKAYIGEYFTLYDKFVTLPGQELNESDWEVLSLMSDGKRLWYSGGAAMAKKIDEVYGRERLTGLMNKPPVEFLQTFRSIP